MSLVNEETLECPRCGKARDLCVCDAIRPLETRTRVLILQHPQEPDVDLGSARLLTLCLPTATLRVGLSWPNLRAALGPDAAGLDVQPSRWAALYLGSGIKANDVKAPIATHPSSAPTTKRGAEPSLLLLDKKGTPLADQSVALDGIVLLDGTWAQAKTLWWRNAWLLKLRRAVLVPANRSLYGELRREPRRECLSTIEAAAEALVAVGEPPAIGDALRAVFTRLLERARSRGASSGASSRHG